MAYVWLTDYVLNTAGLVYQNAGVLNETVTPSMVSAKKKIAFSYVPCVAGAQIITGGLFGMARASQESACVFALASSCHIALSPFIPLRERTGVIFSLSSPARRPLPICAKKKQHLIAAHSCALAKYPLLITEFYSSFNFRPRICLEFSSVLCFSYISREGVSFIKCPRSPSPMLLILNTSLFSIFSDV